MLIVLTLIVNGVIEPGIISLQKNQLKMSHEGILNLGSSYLNVSLTTVNNMYGNKLSSTAGSDLQGHFPTASLFKCDFSYNGRTVKKISAERHMITQR